VMNLRWRFVDIFRIDSIDMNALTGKTHTKCFDRLSGRLRDIHSARRCRRCPALNINVLYVIFFIP
jgi:hypothetical protein